MCKCAICHGPIPPADTTYCLDKNSCWISLECYPAGGKGLVRELTKLALTCLGACNLLRTYNVGVEIPLHLSHLFPKINTRVGLQTPLQAHVPVSD
jgi:hypothetical protein